MVSAGAVAHSWKMALQERARQAHARGAPRLHGEVPERHLRGLLSTLNPGCNLPVGPWSCSVVEGLPWDSTCVSFGYVEWRH